MGDAENPTTHTAELGRIHHQWMPFIASVDDKL